MLFTLIFAVAALDFFMNAFLHFALEDPSSSWFVEAGNFQDMGSIDPIVRAPSHHMISIEFELIHRHLMSVVSRVNIVRRSLYIHCCR